MKPKDKFILIVIFPVVCLNCKSHEIQRIDVKCVDIRIETPFRITCEKFEDFFQEDIDIISIEDQDRIAVFSRIIKELKEADQSKCPLPDTRIKIEIIHKDKKTIMCIDHLVMSISDNLYLTSNAMLEFIEETIKSKSEKEGNNRVVVNQAGAVQQVNHYYAFGGLFGEGAQTVSQRYRYNGKELDTKIGLNMYDYGARHYDAALGRWFTVDPLAEKYYGISLYVYVANNPINAIDPDGKDSYLLIWFSGNNETGQAGIAVDNYKQQQIMDNNGKPVFDSKGNLTYEMVKNRTMTYFDLWPNNPVGKTELQSNVKSDYSKGVVINSVSDLTTTAPTGTRSGNVGAEGRVADGIVQKGTTYDQDAKIQGYASNTANSGKAYNASNFNCSTFAEKALKTVFPALDASQFVKVPFPLNVMYNDTRVVAPNNLYNAAMKLPNATNIRGPKSVVTKPYLQYYGK